MTWPRVENGVCLDCGEGVLESGEHITGDREPCATILGLRLERDEAYRRVGEIDAQRGLASRKNEKAWNRVEFLEAALQLAQSKQPEALKIAEGGR